MLGGDPALPPVQESLPLRPGDRESHYDERPQELLSHSCAAALPLPRGHLGHWTWTERIPIGGTHKREEGAAGIGQASPVLRSHKGALLPRSRSRLSPAEKRLAPHLLRTSEEPLADAHGLVYEPSIELRLSERGRRSLRRAIPVGERAGPAGKLNDASVFAS